MIMSYIKDSFNHALYQGFIIVNTEESFPRSVHNVLTDRMHLVVTTILHIQRVLDIKRIVSGF